MYSNTQIFAGMIFEFSFSHSEEGAFSAHFLFIRLIQKDFLWGKSAVNDFR